MEQIFDIHNIRLIVGLGNIGNDYVKTRHNAGFMFVEDLLRTWNPQLNWSLHKELQAETAVYKTGEQTVILAKPVTMMNLSGQAVAKLINYYKLPPAQVVIAHDDLDLPLGEWRMHFGKGPKGHNGISSVEQFLSSKDFWRARLGIDAREIKGNKGIPGERYALERFRTAELAQLQESITAAITQYFV